jgi:hypothetical protein
MMTEEMKTLVRSLRDLSDRAGQLAKFLDHQRTVQHGGRHGMQSIQTPARTASVMAQDGGAAMALAQLGQVCREFHNSIESTISTMPKEMRP